MTANTNTRAPVKVLVSKKSQASRAPTWERRKLAQVVEAQSGAGSIPAYVSKEIFNGHGYRPGTASS